MRMKLNSEENKDTPGSLITASIKLEIESRILSLTLKTMYAECLQYFIAKQNKTDAQFIQMLQEMQDQFRDAPNAMKKILADHYSFFSSLTKQIQT